eukprot:gene10747-11898_t
MGGLHAKIPPSELNDLCHKTKFEQGELKLWYERFKKDYPSGSISKQQFVELYRGHYKNGDAKKFSEHVFRVFDVNNDGKIDFKEFVCALSVTTRGTLEEKLHWAFSIYDIDGNGRITSKELVTIIRSIKCMADALDDQNISDDKIIGIFKTFDVNNDGVLTADEFMMGARKNPLLMKMLEDYVTS